MPGRITSGSRLTRYAAAGLLIFTIVSPSSVALAQNQGGGLLGRPSPPQPQQKQGIDYFVGTWTVTWTGRESPLSAGPRTGKATFTRVGDSQQLTSLVEGTIDGGGAFKETGTFDWNAEQKTLTIRERVLNNVELSGAGDWTSPIAIRYESQPVTAGGQTLRLRRHYSIVSASSFLVQEELSINGGPFQRLGNGDYRKE
jgi:hypothetical protein